MAKPKKPRRKAKAKAKGPREMVRREMAVQAAANRFAGKPFAWGEADCALMVLEHLKALGVAPDVAKAGKWTSAIGAQRAVRRLGFDTLDAFLDAHFERIPPAFARLGDLVSFEADHPVGALGIHLGLGAVMAYSEDAPEGPIEGRIIEARGAWRVING